jgi:hypothetical protein
MEGMQTKKKKRVVVESTTSTDERKRRGIHESDIETTTTTPETDGTAKSTIVVAKSANLVTITVVTIVKETNLHVTRGIERSTVVLMDTVPVSAVNRIKEVEAAKTMRTRREGMIESRGDVVPATVMTAIEGIGMIARGITGNLESAAIVTAV